MTYPHGLDEGALEPTVLPAGATRRGRHASYSIVDHLYVTAEEKEARAAGARQLHGRGNGYLPEYSPYRVCVRVPWSELFHWHEEFPDQGEWANMARRMNINLTTLGVVSEAVACKLLRCPFCLGGQLQALDGSPALRDLVCGGCGASWQVKALQIRIKNRARISASLDKRVCGGSVEKAERAINSTSFPNLIVFAYWLEAIGKECWWCCEQVVFLPGAAVTPDIFEKRWCGDRPVSRLLLHRVWQHCVTVSVDVNGVCCPIALNAEFQEMVAQLHQRSERKVTEWLAALS